MNKKIILGSLIMLALTMTGCQTPAQSTGDQSKEPEVSSQTPASGESQQSQALSASKPAGEPSIPAPAAGAFAFDDTQLNTAQEIHTENQLKYLNLNKEYYSMGKLLTGVVSFTPYNDDGTLNENGTTTTYYKNGVPATGKYQGLFYVDGKLFSGTYKNKTYENGVRIA